MKEETYFILRKFAFWTMSLVFIFCTPLIVFYSIGYKFDSASSKFLKTGLLSIKTFPKGVNVLMNAHKTGETTPCVLRGLLPKKYNIVLEKEGFYPYEMPVYVRPSFVSEIDVVLVPREKNIEKLKFNFNVYRFFINKQFFGEKIVFFADRGIYILDTDFKNVLKVSSMDLGSILVNSLEGLKQYGNQLIFWNKKNVWMVKVLESNSDILPDIVPLYETEEEIKGVFLGMKDRYLIVHAGSYIFALDVQNPLVTFPVFTPQSPEAKIFYDERTETLFVRDSVPASEGHSLYRIELVPIIAEKKEHEKIS
jgi:hypothetical protein